MFASCSQRIPADSHRIRADERGYLHGIRAGTVACLQAPAVTFASDYNYRQMLPWVLEHLTFRSENRFQPVIEALGAIKQALGTKTPYLPDEVPLEGVVLPSWRDTVLEEQDGAVRVNRQYYELCVLQRLERALKCKEIWVEGASAFRNPSQEMPANWQQEAQRVAYYQGLAQPVQVAAFLDPLRAQLTQTLIRFNHDLPRNPSVRLTTPAANDDRRLFAVDRLTAQPEPQSLGRIKDLINQRYGMVDLLDIFVEAERLTAFTRFFTHAGTKEVRSRDALRPLLLLDLFAEGTKQGIISPKLQLLSGHTTEQSLAIYRALALSDVAGEYEKAMQTFPVR
jgi:hypothetical protein